MATFNAIPSTVPYILSDKFISLIVGPVGCIHGDTLIITEYGALPISVIYKPMYVLSWDAARKDTCFSLASPSFIKGNDYLYNVVTSNGSFVAAGSHRLLCSDGVYRCVTELSVGDVLLCDSVPAHVPIIEISRRAIKEDYWDIQVENTHNYITVDGAIHHNSTKTTASIIKIIHEASKVAKCKDGIRRSRCAVIRNTRQMLYDTTIPDFLKWYPDGEAGLFMKTDSKFLLKMDDIECEVLFRGLDDQNDVRRLLSLQLTFAMMDEFREINPQIFNVLTTRLGRYPDSTMVPHRPEWGVDAKGFPIAGCVDDTGKQVKKIWGASNPPDMDTFWEQFISNPPANAEVIIQPSGLSPEADWLHCLPSDYYENICEGKTQDWIDVYVHGKFGKSLQGQPVFRCFDKATHVAKSAITPVPNTLVIGVDAGLNPTAVITQQTYDGRVIVLDAVTGDEDGMGALRFCREKLKPLLANKYANRPHVIIIDPAAFQRAQTDERSVADIFKIEGFNIKPAKTNTITARIAVVEAYLTRTVNGNPGLLIDPKCEGLITALRSKYRYKVNTKGEKDDKPEKSHPWSDYVDALQYACLYHDGGSLTGGKILRDKVEVKPAPYRWAA